MPNFLIKFFFVFLCGMMFSSAVLASSLGRQLEDQVEKQTVSGKISSQRLADGKMDEKSTDEMDRAKPRKRFEPDTGPERALSRARETRALKTRRVVANQ